MEGTPRTRKKVHFGGTMSLGTGKQGVGGGEGGASDVIDRGCVLNPRASRLPGFLLKVAILIAVVAVASYACCIGCSSCVGYS